MPRKDSLGRTRRPAQDATTFKPAKPGRVSRSHNVNMTLEQHEQFKRLTAQERGDLVARVLAEAAE